MDDPSHHTPGELDVLVVGADAPEALVDVDGETLTRLGTENAGQYFVRPDGHVAFRCAGTELSRTTTYLGRWFTSDEGS